MYIYVWVHSHSENSYAIWSVLISYMFNNGKKMAIAILQYLFCAKYSVRYFIFYSILHNPKFFNVGSIVLQCDENVSQKVLDLFKFTV